jgi:hypothetical protein
MIEEAGKSEGGQPSCLASVRVGRRFAILITALLLLLLWLAQSRCTKLHTTPKKEIVS